MILKFYPSDSFGVGEVEKYLLIYNCEKKSGKKTRKKKPKNRALKF